MSAFLHTSVPHPSSLHSRVLTHCSVKDAFSPLLEGLEGNPLMDLLMGGKEEGG